ncbi:MAG: type IX secretion system sortase PorU [Bacteroidetes bacterium]|nr:type IX secretion system sortase PorU [Bacteroidota bacterium]
MTLKKLSLIMTFILATQLLAEAKPLLSGIVTHSLLSSGKWIKLAIKTTGIYKITYSDLQKMGINPASINPANLRIVGNGGGMLPETLGSPYYDDLIENRIWVEGEADGHFDMNDYILFYATAPDTWSFNGQQLFIHKKNLYSDQTFYFLTTDNGPGLRIKSKDQAVTAATHQVNTFNDFAVYEKDELNLIQSGRQWFGKELLNGQSPTISFQFDNVDDTSPAQIRINAAARSSNLSSIVLKNGSQQQQLNIPPISLSDYTNDFAAMGSAVFSFQQPASKFDLNLSYPKTSDVGTAWVEFIEINLRRKLIFKSGQLPFTDILSQGTQNVAQYNLKSGASATVWEVTDPLHPSMMNTTIVGQDLSFKLAADTLRSFIAFDNSVFLTPEIIGAIANQDLHGADVPDLLIVTNPLFMNAANRLADFRASHDGLKVLVATTDAIYNEFSSGAQDISAIRYFCKRLYDKGAANRKFKYLLLMGDGSYDYKSRIAQNTNYVPTYESTNSLSPIVSYATDDYFGFLDNGEGNSINDNIDIGIGRLPVKTAAEATGVVEKIIYYSTNSPLVNGDWRNSICFVADDKEYNAFMDQAEELANQVSNLNASLNIDKIYLDAFPEVSAATGKTYPLVNEAIDQRIDKGTLIINYTGHGGEAGWAQEQVLTLNDIAKWKSFNNLPVFITATCEFSRFDNPQLLSAGEQILLNPTGGAAALFTTIRLTFGSPNFTLNKSLLNNWVTPSGKYFRLGDVLRLAKLENSNTNNTQKFVLLGDPSMQLAFPKYRVITSTINDKEPGVDTLKALSKVTVKGFIADNNGAPKTTFNGTLYPSIYDKASLVNTLGNDGEPVYSFWLQKNLIYKGKTDVVNGVFNFSFIVPKDIALRFDKGKFSYYATNGTDDAVGNESRSVIGGFSDIPITDKTGPMARLFLNDTLFRQGGLTGTSPTLLAYINDESGINTLGTGIGHDITAVIDDKTDHTIILNDYFEATKNNYKSGMLAYTLSNLQPGEHKIKFKVWDVMNNSSTSELLFKVKDEANLETGEIMVWPNPFSTSTSFTIRHNQSGKIVKAEVRIYNPKGNLIRIFTANSTTDEGIVGPFYWDGTTIKGQKLSSGLYIFQVILESENGITSIRNGKVVIAN